jgi:hypothetical protein
MNPIQTNTMKLQCRNLWTAALSMVAVSQLSLGNAQAQCCGRVSENQPRIVGGSTAPRGAYPWMAALVERGQTPANGQFCGGALIAPQWVLTAGHCVEGNTAARMDVIIGAYNLNETNGGGQRIQVTQIISHPGYGDINGTLSNDVALLKLAVPVTNVPVIPLVNSTSQFAAGVACKGMGFGLTSDGGSPSAILLHVDMSIISQAIANSVYGGITDAHVAAGVPAGGRDTCQGDSGGPLVVADGRGGWLHAGVVSFGDGCAKVGVPGIYASTFKYAPWITQTIGVIPPPVVTDDYGNTTATAFTASLATAVNGKLEAAGDVDVFKFTATGAGTMNVISTGTTAVNGQWLNSAGTALTAVTGAPNINLNTAVTAAGNYFLVIKGATTATTGAYSVKATFTATPVTGAPEINLTGKGNVAIATGAAANATAGTAFGTINVGASASQVFTLTNSGNATLTVGTAQLSGAGASQFKISVQPATSIAAARTGTFTVAYSPTSAGTHAATVTISNNDANENPYIIQLTGSALAVSGDDYGNTLATAKLVTIPSSLVGKLDAGDLDVFKFTLTATTTVTLRTTGAIDTYGTLFASNGSVITEADDAADLNFSIRRKLNAGTYYLEVSGYDETISGAYTVQFVK